MRDIKKGMLDELQKKQKEYEKRLDTAKEDQKFLPVRIVILKRFGKWIEGQSN